MQRRSNKRTILSWLALVAVIAGVFAFESTPAANAAPGSLPTPFTFSALGSDQFVGNTQTRLNSPHPGSPVACNDAIENESASSGVQDGKIDFANVDVQCTSAADDSEEIVTTAATAGFPPTGNVPRAIATCPGTTAGAGGAITVPIAGVTIPTSYSSQFTTNAAGLGIDTLTDNAVALKPIGAGVAPPAGAGGTAPVSGCAAGTATAWTGTQGPGAGQMTITGCVYIDVNLKIVTCTGFLCVAVPTNPICRSDSFTVSFTTEATASLTGNRYDAAQKNVKLVSESGSGGATVIPGLKPQAGGLVGSACTAANTQFGLGGARTATDKFSFTLSSDTTFTSGGANACLVAGTGPQTGGFIPQTDTSCWPPVLNGTINGTPSATGSVVSVPEGTAVTADWFNAFDPAGRTLTPGFTSVSPAVPATKSTADTNRTFVAPNGHAGGTAVTVGATETAGFQKLVGTSLITLNATQTASGIPVTSTNVAPTSNAGPDQLVNPGTINLKGSSADPSDPESARTYAWAWQSGPANVAPASPTSKTTTVALATPGTYVYQLTVNDGDGGVGTDTMSIQVRAVAAAGTLSGVITDNATPGVGLAGATASVYLGAPIGSPVQTSAATGASGAWSVTGLAAGTYFVKYSKAGYQDEWYLGALGSSGAKGTTAPNSLVDGSLAATATLKTISGNVVNQANAGVGAVNVRLYDETGWLATTSSAGGTGAFSFGNLKPKSTYRVLVAQGDATYRQVWFGDALVGSSATLINASASSPVLGNIKVYTAAQVGTLSGAVTGCATTCVGVNVRVYGASSGWVADVKTDGSGNYSIPNLRPGSYRIWAWTKWAGALPNITARKSQWFNGLTGEQYDNTGAIADIKAINAGANPQSFVLIP